MVKTIADNHHMRTCNYCNADIFNRCYRCPNYDDCDICLLCVAEGRGCTHNNLELVETIPFSEVKKVETDGEKCYLDIHEALEHNRYVIGSATPLMFP